MTDLRFDKDVVLLTGAAAGLGRAYAEHLAARGARLILNDIDEAVVALADTFRGQGVDAYAVLGSVADPATATTMTSSAIERFGRIDALINNAGIARRKPAAETSLAEHRELMEVNFFAALQIAEAALPAMQARGYGRIVNVVSTSLFGADGFAAYAATKGALLG